MDDNFYACKLADVFYNYREVLGITALEHGSVHPVQLKCIVGTLLHSPHAAALSPSGQHDICSPEALNQRHHLCLRWTGMFGRNLSIVIIPL